MPMQSDTVIDTSQRPGPCRNQILIPRDISHDTPKEQSIWQHGPKVSPLSNLSLAKGQVKSIC